MPRQTDPAVPARYGPQEEVPDNRLIAGVVVGRWTEPVGPRHPNKVDQRVPCCGRHARVTAGKGQVLIACTLCGVVYETALVDENDDSRDNRSSYVAVLTVSEFTDVTFAWRRPATTGRTA